MSADAAWMRRALQLAQSARRVSPPNPWVGCVIVDHAGTLVGDGSTQAPGGPHAEIVALAAAGSRAHAATVYTTLEPCAHYGRTGPCADALIAAGVSRVVVGIEDPDHQVAGRGVAQLRAAGVEVVVGVESDAVTELLAAYLHHRRSGRPWVIAKVAATLDGAMAMRDGSSQWITSEAARRDAHELRADSQAILVGAGTVRADNPRLTARIDGQVVEPLRVVLGHAPPDAAVHPCVELQGPLEPVLDELGRRGVVQLLVEGGPSVFGAFLDAGLVNRVVWYAAPAFAGDGRPALGGVSTPTIEALRRGRILGVRQVGDDVRIDVEV